MYTIKELAEKTGIIPNAIRFYEKKGLLCPKRTENNYRVYEAEDVTRLEQILLYRKMGFSIGNIKELLDKNADVMEQIVAQYTLLNRHIHSMVHIRETLGRLIEDMLNRDGTENILEEDMLAQIAETAKLISLSENWQDEWNFDNQATVYDSLIREYDDGLNFYKNYDLVLEKAAQKVSGGVVVEIGIGTGNLAVQVLKQAKEQEKTVIYIGVDQSINMLKEAKKKCPEIGLKKGDFLNLPLEAKSCDAIVTSYAFHHCDVEEKVLAAAEMDRVLREKGSVVIADLMFADQKARELFAETCSAREREDLADEFFGNVDEISKLFTELGYECEAEQIDELIWIISAAKK
ncbi:MAG: MerR family transcriptional regulator [Lachnospiraceae bacterium]|nr:MerR family transcriptional regulator [Lachnospiraceae bacterium]